MTEATAFACIARRKSSLSAWKRCRGRPSAFVARRRRTVTSLRMPSRSTICWQPPNPAIFYKGREINLAPLVRLGFCGCRSALSRSAATHIPHCLSSPGVVLVELSDMGTVGISRVDHHAVPETPGFPGRQSKTAVLALVVLKVAQPEDV